MINDTFTDTNGVSLQDHTPDSGGTWIPIRLQYTTSLNYGTNYLTADFTVQSNQAAPNTTNDNDNNHIGNVITINTGVDFIITCQLTTPSTMNTARLGIIFRSNANNNVNEVENFNWNLRPDLNNWRLRKMVAGNEVVVINSTPYTFVTSTTYDLKIIVTGNTFEFFIDDVSQDTYIDSDFSEYNYVGIGKITGNSEYRIDNFQVTYLPKEGTSYSKAIASGSGYVTSSSCTLESHEAIGEAAIGEENTSCIVLKSNSYAITNADGSVGTTITEIDGSGLSFSLSRIVASNFVESNGAGNSYAFNNIDMVSNLEISQAGSSISIGSTDAISHISIFGEGILQGMEQAENTCHISIDGAAIESSYSFSETNQHLSIYGNGSDHELGLSFADGNVVIIGPQEVNGDGVSYSYSVSNANSLVELNAEAINSTNTIISCTALLSTDGEGVDYVYGLNVGAGTYEIVGHSIGIARSITEGAPGIISSNGSGTAWGYITSNTNSFIEQYSKEISSFAYFVTPIISNLEIEQGGAQYAYENVSIISIVGDVEPDIVRGLVYLRTSMSIAVYTRSSLNDKMYTRESIKGQTFGVSSTQKKLEL